MSQRIPPLDITRVKEANAREVLRLSEVYLDSTTKFAIASDARAVTLSTMMATLMTATAAVGAAIIALPPEHRTTFTRFLWVALLSASACYLMALIKATNAARPETFDVPGNYLSSFTDADLQGEPKALLIAQAEIYEYQIGLNNARLQANAESLRAALGWVKFSPFVAAIAGAIGTAFPSG
ncbi:hypothetical protein [Acidisphaera sp. S103]|uniref:hypothetical protein n=1 Tax=Acidisphaera sp. S103 TaxID=1747223 RepID=UPI00131E11CD|nr:hypothetical protein [Acidisphaera sp. S103]